MPITVTNEARTLVSVVGDQVFFLANGLRDNRETDDQHPFVPVRPGDRLLIGNEIWTFAPTSGEVSILVFRDNTVNLEEPAGRIGPTAREIDRLLLGEAPELQADDPDAIRTTVSVPDEPALLDTEVIAVGMTQLVSLHEFLGTTLDLMTMESDMICDATDLAIDQVQDMRIAWQEEGPEVEMSDVVLQAIFLTIIELSVAKVVGELLARGHRSWARNRVAAVIKKARRGRSDTMTAVQQLRTIRQKYVGRVHHANKLAQQELRSVPNLSKFPAGSRTPALAERARGFRAAPHLERARDLATTVRISDRALASWQKEVRVTREAMKKLSTDFSRMSAGQKFDNKQLAELFKGPALDSAIPSVSKVASKVAKAIAKDLPVAGTDDALGEAAKVSPQAAALRDPSVPEPGDSPSTVLRIQALSLRRSQREEIARIRREANTLVKQALERPEHGFPEALATLREVTIRLALPEQSRSEYLRAIRELAREIEFSIWSLVLPVFLDHRRASDLFKGGPDVPGYDLYVRNASKRIISYLSERFGALYRDREGVNDVERLVGALSKRRTRLNDHKESVVADLVESGGPLLEPTRLGTLKGFVLDEVEGELDERQEDTDPTVPTVGSGSESS